MASGSSTSRTQSSATPGSAMRTSLCCRDVQMPMLIRMLMHSEPSSCVADAYVRAYAHAYAHDLIMLMLVVMAVCSCICPWCG
eukprot:926300-Alexandrium_andersonii.AAC.1